MKKKQEGIVIEVIQNLARVKVSRHSDCKNCGACPGSDALIIDAENSIGAKVGQRVVYEVEETNVLKVAFIIYIIPIILTFSGVFIGFLLNNKNNIFQIYGGISGFILSVIYIKFFDKSLSRKRKLYPKIEKILEKQ